VAVIDHGNPSLRSGSTSEALPDIPLEQSTHPLFLACYDNSLGLTCLSFSQSKQVTIANGALGCEK
jgi:hypothetical protein